MPSSPPTKAPATAFVCASGRWLSSACKGLPFFKEHEGKRYCVLHYPGKEKSAAFREVLKKKLEDQDLDFRGVWFPDDVDFTEFTFNKPINFGFATFSADANFSSATFSGEAYFSSTTFSARANFGRAVFSARAAFFAAVFNADADFISTTFSAKADFSSATFHAQVIFGFAIFGAEVSFRHSMFDANASFLYAKFKDYVRFAGGKDRFIFGEESFLSLQSAEIEKPDRVSFHTLMLRPNWFIGVDARKFEFIDVNWNWRRIKTGSEVESLKESKVSSPHILLAIACRNLAVNAEENHRYEEASRFRYMAMDARRVERWRGFAFWHLGWWYWLASGYGERVLRAFVIIIAIWWGFALIYFRAECTDTSPPGRRVCVEWEQKEAVPSPRESFSRSLAYTLNVMTLQKPEPRPASPAAQMLVTLCTILGPVQAALLALAIRRKFMR